VTAAPAPATVVTGADPSTAERILDAAEALVADRGVDAVSLRAVNTAAGANVAAAHYHFGSKDAVLEAVLRRRMAVVSERRDQLVTALASSPRPSPRAAVDALVAPLAEFAATDDGRVYVRFLAALSRADGRSRALMTTAFAPQYPRFVEQLQRALPRVAPEVLGFRLGLAGRTIVECLAESGPDRAEALVDYVTGALGAPGQGGIS
jgi:AcrR family transcriptional regulator